MSAAAPPAAPAANGGPPAGRPVRSPTVLQMEAVECGAAALAMVLAHHGRWEPLEQLRVTCGVSRDGSNAAAVLRAARSFGLEARGFRLEPDSLRKQRFPLIVFWRFNHFVVVDGFKGDRVLINDPASGRRTVTLEDFDASFTGIALTFEPGEAFEPGGRKPSVLAELRTRMDRSRDALVLVLLLSLLLVVPGLALPAFQRVFVDDVLVAGRDGALWWIAGGMVAVAALIAALTMAQQGALLRLETRLAVTSSARFLRHVLRLPVEFFGQRQAADISSRVTSNDTVAQILSRDLATAAVSAVVALFYAVVLFATDVLLASIGVAFVLLNLVALQAVARVRKEATGKLEQERGKLVGTTYAGIQMIETLKATGREGEFFGRWAGFHAKLVSASQQLAVPTQLLNAVPLFLATVNSAFILYVGSERVVAGAITIGLLVAFQTLMSSFAKPVTDLSALGSRAQDASADLMRLADVERYPAEVRPAASTATEGRRLSGSLELERVTFGYSPLAPPLIDGLSLRLEPGSRIALVGGSGSGKSTVARLIAGLHEPWSGEVRFDGLRRAEIPREVLAGSVGVVDQEVFLFEGTVRDNLTLWDEVVPDEQLVAALRDAAVHDEIMARRDGLRSGVREGGTDLSGGQRQRLEIARALVLDPSLLVLDEATSALDTGTERHIDAALRRRGCACVIVAHRLSTIRDCDEILVFDRGAVVQRGTHDDMKDEDGPYAELIRST